MCALPNKRYVLRKILFKFNRESHGLELSIGAPSSPLISNVMLYEFDRLVHDFCIGADISYTRYADDISFSTNTPEILRDCKSHVEKVLRDLRYPTLTLNQQKTIETSKKRGRRITGLTITGDGQVSVGRERKRELRVQILWSRLPARDLMEQTDPALETESPQYSFSVFAEQRKRAQLALSPSCLW